MRMDFRTKLTQQNAVIKSEICEVGEREQWRPGTPEEEQRAVNGDVEAERIPL